VEWSDWRSIYECAAFNGHAVYRVRLVGADRPIPIPRFLGTDDEGILSIGTTSVMDDRRQQFVTGVEECYGHSSANLLYYLERFTTIKSLHAHLGYQYCFREVESREQAEKLETVLIKTYFLRFGEPPPLNSAIPDRYDESTWSDAFGQAKLKH